MKTKAYSGWPVSGRAGKSIANSLFGGFPSWTGAKAKGLMEKNKHRKIKHEKPIGWLIASENEIKRQLTP